MHHIPIEGSEEADVSWFVAQLFRNTKRPYQKNQKKRKRKRGNRCTGKIGHRKGDSNCCEWPSCFKCLYAVYIGPSSIPYIRDDLVTLQTGEKLKLMK